MYYITIYPIIIRQQIIAVFVRYELKQIFATLCRMEHKHLGELEQTIMDIVWRDEQTSATRVLRELKKERRIAYTTIATILQRLYDKGLVQRHKKDGCYQYEAKVEKEHFIQHISSSFLNRLMGSFGDTALASFARSIDTLPPEKRKLLLQQLESYEQQK